MGITREEREHMCADLNSEQDMRERMTKHWVLEELT